MKRLQWFNCADCPYAEEEWRSGNLMYWCRKEPQLKAIGKHIALAETRPDCPIPDADNTEFNRLLKANASMSRTLNEQRERQNYGDDDDSDDDDGQPISIPWSQG